jgi:hypothetical protein
MFLYKEAKMFQKSSGHLIFLGVRSVKFIPPDKGILEWCTLSYATPLLFQCNLYQDLEVQGVDVLH